MSEFRVIPRGPNTFELFYVAINVKLQLTFAAINVRILYYDSETTNFEISQNVKLVLFFYWSGNVLVEKCSVMSNFMVYSMCFS